MSHGESKSCCINCFSDPEIQSFVEDVDTIGRCDYCESSDVKIRDVEEVGQFILEGLLRYYEDAAEHVGYESAEGGYLLSTDTISEILLYEIDIFGEKLTDPTYLAEDLIDDDGTPYVKKDPYGPPAGEPEEIDDWEHFCETVKNDQRFTALLKLNNADKYDNSHPINLLEKLADGFLPSLLMHLPRGMNIYRARIEEKNEIFQHKDLTSPPPEKTRNSRMSPVGISFYYGGLDAATCISEVRASVGGKVAVAEFEIQKELTILDLSKDIEEFKSIFNEEYYFNYEEYYKPLLRHFVTEIAKPIQKSDMDTEYIPTQVLTEFIKMRSITDLYMPNTDHKIDGIMFKSSLRTDGINIVLFKGADVSTEDITQNSEAWLLYKATKRYVITEIDVRFRAVNE
ncbi:MAG: RES domain-containing protein [Nitrospirae bacterium]|nr:RES domain-containing protein [Nitrospirota bacterium]